MMPITNRADCFFPDGTYLSVPVGPGDPSLRIRLILLLAGQQNPGEEVIEIQTDDGIWTPEDGFIGWEMA